MNRKLLFVLIVVSSGNTFADTPLKSRLYADGAILPDGTAVEKLTDAGPRTNKNPGEMEEIKTANLCLQSIKAFPGGLSKAAMLFDSSDIHKPVQILTTDPWFRASDATSAVINPNGQIVQIRSNGSCELTRKKFKSSYDFVAEGLSEASVAEAMSKLPVNIENKKSIKDNCSNLPNREPFNAIRNVLEKAGFVDRISSQDKSDISPAATQR
jgi:hypothetical protein